MTQPPYRNLKVWVESFDLALDIFQLTRSFDGADSRSIAKRLIEASSRMPVAVARGQSSGSTADFIRCLKQGLSDLTELESQLITCRELRYITVGQLRVYQGRLLAIRNAANRLLHRLTRQVRPSEREATPTGT